MIAQKLSLYRISAKIYLVRSIIVMKKFENPELSAYNFSVEDIITTSTSLENPEGVPDGTDNEQPL